ncbi:MAG: SMC-Scp complex subunit ScpB [Candidatus Gygaella obscura]|nr:SMC-Scp complex subunit ScpB [Candidatus Gygaella obscura]
MTTTPIKSIIEALLFVNEQPINLEQIKAIFDEADIKSIRAALTQLQDDYVQQDRGIRIIEIAGGFQMVTHSECVHFLKKFYSKRQLSRLSTPALETLAIIAYKQPISRQEIELIRGVNVDGVVSSITERGLIRITGRRESLGRPFVYGTTKKFLEYFGLKSLSDLPKIEDFSKMVPHDEIDVSEGSSENGIDSDMKNCESDVDSDGKENINTNEEIKEETKDVT